jgi:hypothetical protein
MILLSANGFCQSVREIQPEIVHTFASGSSGNSLGMNALAKSSGADNDSGPRDLSVDYDFIYILDNVNNRIVKLSKKYQFIASYESDCYGLSKIWLGPTYIVAGRNVFGADSLKGIFYFANATDNPIVVRGLNEEDFHNSDNSDYDLISQINNILYFQNQRGAYFGLRLSNMDDRSLPEFLKENDLRVEFKKKSTSRFDWNGEYFFDHGTLISASLNTVLKYFNGLPGFDSSRYSFLNAASRLVPLPSETYIFFGSRDFYFFDKNGKNLDSSIIPDQDRFFPTSQFVPAPDGYIYYLHSDFQNEKTLLYRIGPYPEIKLGYGGNSGTINDNLVNVRENHNLEAAVLCQLNRGSSVGIIDKTTLSEKINGQTSVWYKVRLWNRTEGWVFGAFLDVPK